MIRWLIVGGGTAGCVLAARLSEIAGNHVIVLEAGPDHGSSPIPGDLGTLEDEPARLLANSAVVRQRGGVPAPYLQGFGLGGSSLVNGGVVVAAAAAQVEGEHQLPLEAPQRLGPVGAALIDADADARPLLLARRAGQRLSTADVYLRPALGRTNLTVITDADVTRLVVEGTSIVGVATSDGAAYVADRVVVCAGAIRTPTLLLRSGIDTPGIGLGLQDQPAMFLPIELAPGQVDAGAPSITASIECPKGQILAVNHLRDLPSMGALMVGLTSVTSVGAVSLPDPDGPPCVELNLLGTETDLVAMVALVRQAFDLLATPSMRSVATAAFVDDRGTPVSAIAGDDDAITSWLAGQLAGYHHVAGSCREGAVTDEWGNVNGYRNLAICDSSRFVGVPVNPYLSVVVMAERQAAHWCRSPDS